LETNIAPPHTKNASPKPARVSISIIVFACAIQAPSQSPAEPAIIANPKNTIVVAIKLKNVFMCPFFVVIN
jgi:hypothetical protein